MSENPGSSSSTSNEQKNESLDASNLDESEVGLFDLVKDAEEEEATVLAVLGGSDENQCTYSKVKIFCLN